MHINLLSAIVQITFVTTDDITTPVLHLVSHLARTAAPTPGRVVDPDLPTLKLPQLSHRIVLVHLVASSPLIVVRAHQTEKSLLMMICQVSSAGHVRAGATALQTTVRQNAQISDVKN